MLRCIDAGTKEVPVTPGQSLVVPRRQDNRVHLAELPELRLFHGQRIDQRHMAVFDDGEGVALRVTDSIIPDLPAIDVRSDFVQRTGMSVGFTHVRRINTSRDCSHQRGRAGALSPMPPNLWQTWRQGASMQFVRGSGILLHPTSLPGPTASATGSRCVGASQVARAGPRQPDLVAGASAGSDRLRDSPYQASRPLPEIPCLISPDPGRGGLGLDLCAPNALAARSGRREAAGAFSAGRAGPRRENSWPEPPTTRGLREFSAVVLLAGGFSPCSWP